MIKVLKKEKVEKPFLSFWHCMVLAELDIDPKEGRDNLLCIIEQLEGESVEKEYETTTYNISLVWSPDKNDARND